MHPIVCASQGGRGTPVVKLCSWLRVLGSPTSPRPTGTCRGWQSRRMGPWRGGKGWGGGAGRPKLPPPEAGGERGDAASRERPATRGNPWAGEMRSGAPHRGTSDSGRERCSTPTRAGTPPSPTHRSAHTVRIPQQRANISTLCASATHQSTARLQELCSHPAAPPSTPCPKEAL